MSDFSFIFEVVIHAAARSRSGFLRVDLKSRRHFRRFIREEG